MKGLRMKALRRYGSGTAAVVADRNQGRNTMSYRLLSMKVVLSLLALAGLPAAALAQSQSAATQPAAKPPVPPALGGTEKPAFAMEPAGSLALEFGLDIGWSYRRGSSFGRRWDFTPGGLLSIGYRFTPQWAGLFDTLWDAQQDQQNLFLGLALQRQSPGDIFHAALGFTGAELTCLQASIPSAPPPCGAAFGPGALLIDVTPTRSGHIGTALFASASWINNTSTSIRFFLLSFGYTFFGIPISS